MPSRIRDAWGYRPLYGVLAVLAAITLLACGGGAALTEPLAAPLTPTVGLSISPSALSLMVGDRARLTGRAYDAKDRTTITSFAWSSADPAIATVGRVDGTITAISAGNTTVTATLGTLSATATVAVRPHPPVAISILPSAFTLIVGGVERVTARALDSAGRTTSATFEWSSADLAVATVGKTDGIVTAIATGTTTVTAAAGALRATATVSVVSTIALAGSVSFTRTSQTGTGSYTADVVSFSVADRTMRSLARPSQFGSIAGPAWSTDGTRLVVEVISGFVAGCPWVEYNSDLYVLDAAASGEARWRALTTNGLSKSPSWSPDGTRIAYLTQPALFTNNDIYVIDAAGGAPVRLTRTDGSYSGPRWSPDGTRLAFTDWNVGNGDVFIVNADGSGLTNVTRSAASDFDPSWSPDGARLAFVSDRDNSLDSYHSDVYLVDPDGSNVRRLTSSGNYSGGPAWSPDGRHIVFSSGRAIYLMNADGSSLVRLTTPPLDSWDSAAAWRR